MKYGKTFPALWSLNWLICTRTQLGFFQFWKVIRNLSDLKVCQKLSDQAFQRALAMHGSLHLCVLTFKINLILLSVHVHADEEGNGVRHGWRGNSCFILFAPSFFCFFCFYHYLLRQHPKWCAFLPSLMPFLLSLPYHLCTHQCQNEGSRRAPSVIVDSLDTTPTLVREEETLETCGRGNGKWHSFNQRTY